MALQFHYPFTRFKFRFDGSDIGRSERTIYIRCETATNFILPSSMADMNRYINPLWVLSGIPAETFAERVIDSSKKVEVVSNAVDFD